MVQQQADDLGWLRWPVRTALLGPVVLLGDEIPIPAEDRVGAGDGGDFAQGLAAERFGESGEAAALRVRQANAPAKLLEEMRFSVFKYSIVRSWWRAIQVPIQAAAN